MAFEKLTKILGISDEDEYEDDSFEESEVSYQEDKRNDKKSNIVSINSVNAGKSRIVLFEPRVYSDAKEVSQNLLNNRAVIINFSRMDEGQSKRIVDFVMGTVYALNGDIQRVGEKIFLATPPKFVTDGKIADATSEKDNL